MQQVYPYDHFKGFESAGRVQTRLLCHPELKEIERRLKVISFFDRYGAEATKDAFGVSRSTAYSWRKKLKESGGKLARVNYQLIVAFLGDCFTHSIRSQRREAILNRFATHNVIARSVSDEATSHPIYPKLTQTSWLNRLGTGCS